MEKYPQNNANNLEKKANKAESNDKSFMDVMRKPAAMALIFASLMIPTGCGDREVATPSGNSVSTSDTLKPGEKPAEVVAEVENVWEVGDPVFESATEMGAKKFIETYGDYFADPASVYNAEITYESEHDGQSLIIDPEYIEAYDFGGAIAPSEKSPLGFEQAIFPISKEINIDSVKDFFDNYVKEQFDTYMNLIAKNPSGDAQMVIDREFLNHCVASDTTKGDFDSFDIYGEEGLKLMNTLKSAALKYGGSANYSVYKSSNDLDDFTDELVENTYIADEQISSLQISADGSNQFSTWMIPRMEVDIFDKKTVTTSIDPFGDPSSDYSIGFKIMRDHVNGTETPFIDSVTIGRTT